VGELLPPVPLVAPPLATLRLASLSIPWQDVMFLLDSMRIPLLKPECFPLSIRSLVFLIIAYQLYRSSFHKLTMNCINCSSCRSQINFKFHVKEALSLPYLIYLLLTKEQFCTSFLGLISLSFCGLMKNANNTYFNTYPISTLCSLKKKECLSTYNNKRQLNI